MDKEMMDFAGVDIKASRETAKFSLEKKIKHLREKADRLEIFLNAIPFDSLDEVSEQVLWAMIVSTNTDSYYL